MKTAPLAGAPFPQANHRRPSAPNRRSFARNRAWLAKDRAPLAKDREKAVVNPPPLVEDSSRAKESPPSEVVGSRSLAMESRWLALKSSSLVLDRRPATDDSESAAMKSRSLVCNPQRSAGDGQRRAGQSVASRGRVIAARSRSNEESGGFTMARGRFEIAERTIHRLAGGRFPAAFSRLPTSGAPSIVAGLAGLSLERGPSGREHGGDDGGRLRGCNADGGFDAGGPSPWLGPRHANVLSPAGKPPAWLVGARADLNLRLLGPEPSALPDCATPRSTECSRATASTRGGAVLMTVRARIVNAIRQHPGSALTRLLMLCNRTSYSFGIARTIGVSSLPCPHIA